MATIDIARPIGDGVTNSSVLEPILQVVQTVVGTSNAGSSGDSFVRSTANASNSLESTYPSSLLSENKKPTDILARRREQNEASRRKKESGSTAEPKQPRFSPQATGKERAEFYKANSKALENSRGLISQENIAFIYDAPTLAEYNLRFLKKVQEVAQPDLQYVWNNIYFGNGDEGIGINRYFSRGLRDSPNDITWGVNRVEVENAKWALTSFDNIVGQLFSQNIASKYAEKPITTLLQYLFKNNSIAAGSTDSFNLRKVLNEHNKIWQRVDRTEPEVASYLKALTEFARKNGNATLQQADEFTQRYLEENFSGLDLQIIRDQLGLGSSNSSLFATVNVVRTSLQAIIRNNTARSSAATQRWESALALFSQPGQSSSNNQPAQTNPS